MIAWKYFSDRAASPINRKDIDLLMNMLIIAKSSLTITPRDRFNISTISNLFKDCRDKSIITENEKKIKERIEEELQLFRYDDKSEKERVKFINDLIIIYEAMLTISNRGSKLTYLNLRVKDLESIDDFNNLKGYLELYNYNKLACQQVVYALFKKAISKGNFEELDKLPSRINIKDNRINQIRFDSFLCINSLNKNKRWLEAMRLIGLAGEFAKYKPESDYVNAVGVGVLGRYDVETKSTNTEKYALEIENLMKELNKYTIKDICKCLKVSQDVQNNIHKHIKGINKKIFEFEYWNDLYENDIFRDTVQRLNSCNNSRDLIKEVIDVANNTDDKEGECIYGLLSHKEARLYLAITLWVEDELKIQDFKVAYMATFLDKNLPIVPTVYKKEVLNQSDFYKLEVAYTGINNTAYAILTMLLDYRCNKGYLNNSFKISDVNEDFKFIILAILECNNALTIPVKHSKEVDFSTNGMVMSSLVKSVFEAVLHFYYKAIKSDVKSVANDIRKAVYKNFLSFKMADVRKAFIEFLCRFITNANSLLDILYYLAHLQEYGNSDDYEYSIIYKANLVPNDADFSKATKLVAYLMSGLYKPLKDGDTGNLVNKGINDKLVFDYSQGLMYGRTGCSEVFIQDSISPDDLCNISKWIDDISKIDNEMKETSTKSNTDLDNKIDEVVMTEIDTINNNQEEDIKEEEKMNNSSNLNDLLEELIAQTVRKTVKEYMQENADTNNDNKSIEKLSDDIKKLTKKVDSIQVTLDNIVKNVKSLDKNINSTLSGITKSMQDMKASIKGDIGDIIVKKNNDLVIKINSTITKAVDKSKESINTTNKKYLDSIEDKIESLDLDNVIKKINTLQKEIETLKGTQKNKEPERVDKKVNQYTDASVNDLLDGIQL